MGLRTNQYLRVIYAFALSFCSFTIATGAVAQSSESADNAASLSSPVKKKKKGNTKKKKKKGKKNNPAANLGDPDASIEFDADVTQKAAESSGSTWIFLISMITFMAGIVFWYTRHQAAESAKHLSDLDFADDNKPGLSTNDPLNRTGQDSGQKKHPLEASLPVFAEEVGKNSTLNDQQPVKRAAGFDSDRPDPEATVLVYASDTEDYKQPVSPGAATVIVAPMAATKIIAQETREAKPIKKS